MRKLRLFGPVLTGLTAGAAYLLVKEDLKRKANGKANFTEAIQKHGVELVTDNTLREASVELLKREVSGVADTVSKAAEEVKTFLSDNTKDFVEDVKEEVNDIRPSTKLFEDSVKQLELTEEEIVDTLEKIKKEVKRGRPKKSEKGE